MVVWVNRAQLGSRQPSGVCSQTVAKVGVTWPEVQCDVIARGSVTSAGMAETAESWLASLSTWLPWLSLHLYTRWPHGRQISCLGINFPFGTNTPKRLRQKLQGILELKVQSHVTSLPLHFSVQRLSQFRFKQGQYTGMDTRRVGPLDGVKRAFLNTSYHTFFARK